MRRSKLMAWAVLVALTLATVPTATVQAGTRALYPVYTTICVGADPTVRTAGPTEHYHDGWHTGDAFFLSVNEWVLSGTFHVDISGGSGSTSSGVRWGTFAVRGSLLGDYDGTWTWNFGQGRDGYGVGQGIGTSAGAHVKVDFLLNDPPGLPDPPADGCGGAPVYGYRYLVMSAPY